MNWLALRMLTGDRSKYLSLILSITFATLLMSQQVSIFMGIVTRSASQIIDVRDADLWVMDNKVRYIDEAPYLPSSDLQRVRGVTGVEWAVRFHKSNMTARLVDGNFRNVVMLGVDDASLVGSPRAMVLGDADDLRLPNAVFIDKAGYEYMWPNEPFRIGREFHINDRRVILAGICKASAPFTTLPILYTRYTEIERFLPSNRSVMNYILAKPADGFEPQAVCQSIEALWADGVDPGWLLLENDRLFSGLDGDSHQLWNHHCPGVYRGGGSCWTDVLPFHPRKSQAIWCPEGHGGYESSTDRHDFASSQRGEWNRVWIGNGHYRVVLHLYQSNRTYGRHSFDGPCGCRSGSRRPDHYFVNEHFQSSKSPVS